MTWTLLLWTALMPSLAADDVQQSVTVNLVRATWPALDGTYTRRLADRHGVHGGLVVGDYNPLSFRSRSSQVGEYHEVLSLYGSIKAGFTGYTYYFKRFDRGWFANADLGLSRTNLVLWAGDSRATLDLTTFTVGPTLGWKRTGKRGFTVLADLGVGYSAVLGDPKATFNGVNDTVSTSVRQRKQGGYGWLGGFEVGWSF